MATFTAFTTLPGRKPAEKLGSAMENMSPPPTGIGVFEVEDNSGIWEIGGYFTDRPEIGELALLAAAFGAKNFVVSEVPETDWVAHVQRELAPVSAGRFFVHGTHDQDKVPDGSHGLLIDAAMAFGTGHHGTTLGCLRALDRLLAQGFMPQSVADIGCGTAVLAMAAAKGIKTTVVASDIDPQAVQVAQANIIANGLEDSISCVESAGLQHPIIAAAAPFDLIFANILKGPLIELAPGFTGNLKPGGILILSGILNEQSDEIVSVYDLIGLKLRFCEQIVDWTTLTLEKIRS